MFDKIGYVEYDNEKDKCKIGYLYNLLFNRINVYSDDNGNIKLGINKVKIDEKYAKKVLKQIKKDKIDAIAISNQINIDKNLFLNNGIIVFNGKVLMKKIILKILEYIYSLRNIDMNLSDIYVTIKNDKEIKIIYDLAENFRCINIVTDKIRRLSRLEQKLEKKEEFIYSISSNRSKSLKKADVIINFDYDSSLFEEYRINRKAILINLNQNKIVMKSGFQGTIIENFDLECDLCNKNNFDNSILYESYIYDLNYEEVKDRYYIDNCIIKALIGTKGKICTNELKR